MAQRLTVWVSRRARAVTKMVVPVALHQTR